MDEAAIRALIATAVAAEVAARIPTTPDLSGYALRGDIPVIPDLSGYATKADVSALASDVAAVVDQSKFTAPPDRETKRLGLWLTRIASKWFADDRPTDAELDAPSVEEVNGRG